MNIEIHSYFFIRINKQKIFRPFVIFVVKVQWYYLCFLHEKSERTKNELFQATIWQKFIYKYPLFAFDAASKKFDEILVLEAGYEFDFIHELTESLNWIWRKSFNRYVLIVRQPTLMKCTCIFTWQINIWVMLSW